MEEGCEPRMMLMCDPEEEQAWKLLQQRFPAQAARLARLDNLEKGLQDNTITRKRRLNTQNRLGPDAGPTTQTLRIYVHHHVLRQPPVSSSASTSSSSYMQLGSRSRGGGGSSGASRAGSSVLPSWVLRIEGGVLEPRGSCSGKGASRLSPHYAFTEFFDRISITGLDPLQSCKGHIGEEDEVDWVREASPTTRPQETDGLELTTALDELPEGTTYRLRIYLHRRQLGEGWARRRRLSPELAKLLRLRKEEMQETIEAALLELINVRQLQAPRQPGWIECDSELCRLFGLQQGAEDGAAAGSKVHLSSLAARLEAHLSEPEPLVLDYKVTPSSEEGGKEEGAEGGQGKPEEKGEDSWRRRGKVFDLEVETEPGHGSLQVSVHALVAKEVGKEEEEEETSTRQFDRQIAYVGSLLVEKARKLARLRAVAEDPVRGIAHLQAEHEAAAMVVGEDSLPAVAGLLRASNAVNVGTAGGVSSSRWLMQALQQYLTQPASLR